MAKKTTTDCPLAIMPTNTALCYENYLDMNCGLPKANERYPDLLPCVRCSLGRRNRIRYAAGTQPFMTAVLHRMLADANIDNDTGTETDNNSNNKP